MTTDVPGRGRLAVCFDFEGGYGMPHHKNLARVCSLLEDFTGSRPQSFRALYLLAPHFYRAEVYAMLRAQGFRCGLPLVVPDLRPGRAVRRGPCPVRRTARGLGDALTDVITADRAVLAKMSAAAREYCAATGWARSPTGRSAS